MQDSEQYKVPTGRDPAQEHESFEELAPTEHMEQNAGMRVETTAAHRILLMIVTFLACLWAFDIFWIANSHRVVVKNSATAREQIANTASVETSNEFLLTEIFLQVAALWVKYKGEAFADKMTLPDELVQDLSRHEHKIEIYLVDNHGNLYKIGEQTNKVLANVADREYFLQEMPHGEHGFSIGRPVLSRTSGEWVIPVVWKLRESIAGLKLVFAAVPVQRLVDIYNNLHVRPSDSIALFRSDGILLARSPFDEKKLNVSYEKTPLFSELLQVQNKGITPMTLTDDEGGFLDAHYVAVPGLPLVVAVAVNRGYGMRDWQQNAMMAIFLTLVASIFIIIFGLNLIKILRRQAVLNAEVARLAMVDYLTGVLNRRRLIEAMGYEYRRARRYHESFGLLMLDLDHFKSINDTHGHSFGDQTLIRFAETVTGCLRNLDFFGRLGGEEFVVLLPKITADNARILAERICSRVYSMDLRNGSTPVPFSVSIGIAVIEDDDTEPNDLLKRADIALYTAKKAGRNQAVFLRRSQCLIV